MASASAGRQLAPVAKLSPTECRAELYKLSGLGAQRRGEYIAYALTVITDAPGHDLVAFGPVALPSANVDELSQLGFVDLTWDKSAVFVCRPDEPFEPIEYWGARQEPGDALFAEVLARQSLPHLLVPLDWAAQCVLAQIRRNARDFTQTKMPVQEFYDLSGVQYAT